MKLNVKSSETPIAIEYVIFNFDGGKIGRNPNSEMCLPCDEKSVSRLHAEIKHENYEYVILDHSANGVYINKSEYPLGQGNAHPLKHGDIIQIGSYLLEANFDEDEDEAAEEPSYPTKSTPPEYTPAPQLLPADSNNISDNRVDFGDTTDSFTPPTTIIPKDWDIDPSNPTKPAPTKATVLDFTSKKSKQLEGLLKSLSPDLDITPEQLTPETMMLLGKTLRISLKALFATRKLIHEAKSRACLDNLPVERQLESCPLENFSSADDFIASLLDNRNKDQRKLPSQLNSAVKNNLEDQRELAKNYQAGITKAHENLAPAAIEIALDKAQRAQSKKSGPMESISNKFTSQTKKWNFYSANWEKLTDASLTRISRDFEAKVLISHAKRMRDKSNETK